jgi:hypothetical protein
LIKEGLFRYTDRIVDLDDRFTNLHDLTVEDILTFGTTFKTSSRIANAKNIEEAHDILFNAEVVEKNKYNYNDIGMMIIKEVIERITGLDYADLVQKYIIEPFQLKGTHLIVPKNKYHLITATPNFRIGHINDMSANVLGGYSGHAGIFSTSDDLIRFLMDVHDSDLDISDAYTPGKLTSAVGRMGNVYVSHPMGLDKSFVDTLEPSDTIAIQGSTRVNANGSRDSAHNILFNPSSMSMEEARERIAKRNEERKKAGKPLLDPVHEFHLLRDGKIERYNLIDPRQLLPLSEMERIIKRNAITTLKLRFFNKVIKAYSASLPRIEVIKNTGK